MTSTPGRTATLTWWFLISLLATAIFSIGMRYWLAPLEPGDIIQFEMAKTPGRAALFLQEWKDTGKLQSALDSVYADYFFILLYTSTLATASLLFSRRSRSPLLAGAGQFIAVLSLVAGVFDVVENIAITRSLTGSLSVAMVDLTYKMAITKFSIVLIALFFVGVCAVSWLANALAGAQEKAESARFETAHFESE